MRPAPSSLAGRLGWMVGGLLLALWTASAGTAAFVVVREINEVFDSILQEEAQMLLGGIISRHAERLAAPVQPPLVVSEATPHDEYITWRLFTGDGRLVMNSHGASEASMLPPGFATIGGARVYTEATPDRRYVISVAEPAGHRGHTVLPTLVRLLGPLFGLVVLALVLIPILLRKGFAPLSKLRAEIARRGGGNLAPLALGPLPDELAAIRDVVDQLLGRVRRALEAERNFSANAAHEMRTPVAVAMAQAQLLAAQAAPGSPMQRDAAQMAAGLARLAARLEKLLQLARAESVATLRRDPVDLLVPLQLLVEEFAAQPSVGTRLHFDDGGLPDLIVAADLDAVAIALRNLIENALRHGPADGIVDISVLPDGAVRVVNGGPVTSRERLEALPARFASRPEQGSGLGLSIVRMIAEQLGGDLILRSPADGREDGFEAVLRFAPGAGPRAIAGH